MVAGPLMQGVLLMSIIYCYSKGLMNMINDYYRGEYHRKLKTEIAQQKIADMKPMPYDLDDMDQLLKIEMNKEFPAYEGVQILDIDMTDIRVKNDLHSNRVCHRLSSRREFLNILFLISYNHYKMYPTKYPICLLNDSNKSI